MILGVAFCPHPPALVPDLGRGTRDELDEIRLKCALAISSVLDRDPQRLVLIGSGDSSKAHGPLARGSLARFGVARSFALGSPGCGGDTDLPLSLTVGAWLLAQQAGGRSGAVGFSVGPGFASSRAALELLGLAETQTVGLIVLGDGSARRTEKAPGYLDDRAAGFDNVVLAALRAGDGQVLADLDESSGAELLAAGVPAWRAAGDLLAGSEFDAQVDYSGDPFGVGYFVAHWIARL